MNTISQEWRAAPWSERIGFVMEAVAWLAAIGLVCFYAYIIGLALSLVIAGK